MKFHISVKATITDKRTRETALNESSQQKVKNQPEE